MSKGMLLIVGADDAARMLLSHYLEVCGYEVSLADDHLEALVRFSESLPEVVVEQCRVTRISALLDSLNRANVEVPVITIVSENGVGEATAAGAAEVLVQPASRSSVLAAIEVQLGKVRAAHLAQQKKSSKEMSSRIEDDATMPWYDGHRMPREDMLRIGRYEIKELIGRGQMGNVFRCWDPALERMVAIKTIRQEIIDHNADNGMITERFQLESAALARLVHPRIIETHNFGVDRERGEMYLVMEYIEGKSMRLRLQEGPLSLREALRVAWEVADAVAHAHAWGVIHRDIKPENVLFTKYRETKLMDFGLARIGGASITDGTALAGTPSYMAPEQVLGRDIDERTDQFALGSVLQEALTGLQCFPGEDIGARLMSVLTEQPPLLVDLGVAAPDELQEMISRMLAKEPKDRFPTDDELLKTFIKVGRLLSIHFERAM